MERKNESHTPPSGSYVSTPSDSPPFPARTDPMAIGGRRRERFCSLTTFISSPSITGSPYITGNAGSFSMERLSLNSAGSYSPSASPPLMGNSSPFLAPHPEGGEEFGLFPCDDLYLSGALPSSSVHSMNLGSAAPTEITATIKPTFLSHLQQSQGDNTASTQEHSWQSQQAPQAWNLSHQQSQHQQQGSGGGGGGGRGGGGDSGGSDEEWSIKSSRGKQKKGGQKASAKKVQGKGSRKKGQGQHGGQSGKGSSPARGTTQPPNRQTSPPTSVWGKPGAASPQKVTAPTSTSPNKPAQISYSSLTKQLSQQAPQQTATSATQKYQPPFRRNVPTATDSQLFDSPSKELHKEHKKEKAGGSRSNQQTSWKTVGSKSSRKQRPHGKKREKRGPANKQS